MCFSVKTNSRLCHDVKAINTSVYIQQPNICGFVNQMWATRQICDRTQISHCTHVKDDKNNQKQNQQTNQTNII